MNENSNCTGSLDLSGAISCFISEALAPCALHGVSGTLSVIYAKRNPVVVPKVELAQISLQMGFGDVLIDAIDAPLEDAEISLNGIGMNVATDVLAFGVVDGAVRSKVVADEGVNVRLIGHQVGFKRDIAGHDTAYSVGADGGHVERAHVAVTFDKGNDRLLLGNGQEGLVPA
jgi:hypothetical protein